MNSTCALWRIVRSRFWLVLAESRETDSVRRLGAQRLLVRLASPEAACTLTARYRGRLGRWRRRAFIPRRIWGLSVMEARLLPPTRILRRGRGVCAIMGRLVSIIIPRSDTTAGW